LQRLKAEDQYGVFARSGGQAANLKAPRIVGDRRDLVGAALGNYGGARNGLSAGAHDAGLYVGSGYSGKDQ
jgi:hypothetical protein